MKLIVVTPAGREKYLRLLSHYVLGSSEVVEWHLWDNCRTEADRAYLERLAASDPRCRIKRLAGANGGFAIIGDFFRFCDDRDALYLRLDDDILGGPDPDAGAPVDPYFKQVYDQFLSVKQSCGEPTAGLTYQKFSEKLVRNRDDLMAKTGCKEVRFTVYVKDGKAALKATPVKDG